MTWRQGRRVCLGLSVLLVFLTTASVSPAFGTTASWELDTSSYNFGSVLLGTRVAHEFVVTNTGETTLVPGIVRLWMRVYGPLDSELFRATNGCHGKNLNPNESCVVTVTFDPGYPGSREGSLRVSAKNGELAPVNAELSGTGVGPQVSIEPEHLILGSTEVGAVSSAQSITVENEGNLGLKIKGISFTDLLGEPQSLSPFDVAGGTCNDWRIVDPGDSCTITVVLKPSDSGVFQSKLAISDDAIDTPQSIEVQGEGTPRTLGPSSDGTVSRAGDNPGQSNDDNVNPPPAVRITRRPPHTTTKRVATFKFSVAPVEASTECEIDHARFVPCFTSTRYAKLSIGRHEFKVRVRSGPGPSTSAVARFHWRIRRYRRRSSSGPISTSQHHHSSRR